MGKRLRFGGGQEWREIIGVVGNTKHWGLEKEVNPEMYLPGFYRGITLLVRTAGEPLSLTSALRAQVRELDRELPLDTVQTLESVMAHSVASPRFYTLLLGLFAAVALLLAAAGIYGVMAYSVEQRTHEIGIRMALGAQTSDVLKLVVGQGLLLALVGVVIGVGAAFALTRLMTKLLFEVTATDPLTFVFIALLLTAVAWLACYIPARRATKVDPMVALRYE